MMNQFDRLIQNARNAALKKRLSGGQDTPTPRIVREPPSREEQRSWTPPGWGILFCVHNKSYFDTCSQCKRDKKRAQLEFNLFCKRRGISV